MNVDNLVIPNIRMFIFGTLRKGCKFDYYMEGGSPLGLYYTRGMLLESETGSAYIDSSISDHRTIGELYHVNYFCLQRIHHLENTSGEFPKGYDLALVPVWKLKNNGESQFSEEEKTIALFYRRRGSMSIPVPEGDWTKRKDTLQEIYSLLSQETSRIIYHDDVINHMMTYLKGPLSLI